jgi:hypothetical protein
MKRVQLLYRDFAKENYSPELMNHPRVSELRELKGGELEI